MVHSLTFAALHLKKYHHLPVQGHPVEAGRPTYNSDRHFYGAQLHDTLHTMRCTYYALQSAHNTLHIMHAHTVRFKVHMTHCKQHDTRCTICCILCVVHYVLHTALDIMYAAVHTTRHTAHATALCTLCFAHCRTHCTQYSLGCMCTQHYTAPPTA